MCGDRRVTFGEFDARAERLAHVLRDGRARTRRQSRDHVRERARVHGGVLRRAEARLRSRQRELPLRRRRARVPPRQLRRRGPRVPRRVRGNGRATRSTRCHPIADPACCSRSRTTATALCSTARATTKSRWSRRRPRHRRTTRETVRRRPRLRLHGRHHRLPQGRDVAQRRPLRVVVADGAPGHRAARRRDVDQRRASRRRRCCPRAR